MPKRKGAKYEHFRNMNAYRKYQAYIHIHKVPHKHHRYVVIDGTRHKVLNAHRKRVRA